VTERRHYVYVLFRPWNMKPCYVGKGQGKRVHDHNKLGVNHPNVRLARIYKKANSALPTLIFAKNLSNEDALDMEKFLIKTIGRKSLANLTDGGDGGLGYEWTKSAKKNQSKRMLGDNNPLRKDPSLSSFNKDNPAQKPAFKARMKGNQFGSYTRTEDTCAKMSAASKEIWAVRKANGFVSPKKGSTMSESSKQKMRERWDERREAGYVSPMKGVSKPEATKQALREAWVRRRERDNAKKVA